MTASEKILVLVDGSERAWETLKYITRVEPLRQKRIVLFHVYDAFPDCYWDNEADRRHPYDLPGFEAWQHEKTARINAFMKAGKAFLCGCGLADDQVEVRIRNRQKGVVKDVLEEAHKGYAAVLMRRRGMGNTKGVTLGSVSCKLLAKLPDVPVLLAGRRPITKRIIIAVDGSSATTRAVSFVCEQLGQYDYVAELLHVIRGVDTFDPTSPEFIPEELQELIREEAVRQIEHLQQQLIDAGFNPDKVSGRVITGVASRAETIVKEAEEKRCGTIVIGRRQLPRVEDFSTGRLCHNVIHSGRDFTVWIP